MTSRAPAVFLLTLSIFALAATPNAGADIVSKLQKISQEEGGLVSSPVAFGYWGISVANLGDIDGTGPAATAIAVGESRPHDGLGSGIWVLLLDANGAVIGEQKIDEDSTGTPFGTTRVGTSLTALGDLDGSGGSVAAVAAGAPTDDDGATNAGAVWILFLNSDGSLHSDHKISDTSGDLVPTPGSLDEGDKFGTGLATLGDLDGPGDGVVTIGVGAGNDDDGSADPDFDSGAVWLLSLREDGTVADSEKLSATTPGLALLEGQRFGHRDLEGLGDLDAGGPSAYALAVGSLRKPEVDPAATGEVSIVFLDADPFSGVSVQGVQKIGEGLGGFAGDLRPPGGTDPGSGGDYDNFGFAIVSPGDIDDDGVVDLIVGAHGDDDGGINVFTNRGAIWPLLLDDDGTVKCTMKVSATTGGLPPGSLSAGEVSGGTPGLHGDLFGISLATLGDINGDGKTEIAVGAMLDPDGSSTNPPVWPDNDYGAVWILTIEDYYCCGDGTNEASEQCDDGNTTPGDGCDEICQQELLTCCGNPGISCNNDGACPTGDTCCLGHCGPELSCDASGGACSSDTQCSAGESCCTACGNGIVETGEQCDDGNTVPLDGCDETCRVEPCGNGVVDDGECCDLGEGNGPATGCSTSCECQGCCLSNCAEPPPLDCSTATECSGGTEGCCGNGILEAGEACDDGNLDGGDCCAIDCTVPPECTPACPGVFGPQLLNPVSMKVRLRDLALDGEYERWTTSRGGKKGDMILRFGQDIDPSTEETRLVFLENDGVNGVRPLGEFAIQPQDWTKCVNKPAGSDDEICKLKDKTETISDPDGVRTAIMKEKGVIVKYKFKGNELGAILKPITDQIRVCLYVGDDAGTSVLDCEEKSGGRLIKCDSTN